jgi:4-hydroxy-tetrahydrodipicolinate synthase
MPSSSAAPRGVYTALVTPFRDGGIDEAAVAHLLEEQIAAGVDGVIPVGTTGESPTLDMEEHLRMIELTVQLVKHRTKVFAGTGSNSTSEALFLTRQAEKLGADGFLLVSPYYNKPSPAGIFAHYSALAQASPLPIITYSVPGRTGSEIAVTTMVELAEKHGNIVAIKEAGGSIERYSQLRRALPERVSVLCGDDSMTLPALAVGAAGVISVASNLIPREVGEMVRTFLKGHAREAEQLHRKFYPLFRDLFIEPNPVPIKTALARQGWMKEDVRLPLTPMQPETRARLEATLKEFGLLGKS